MIEKVKIFSDGGARGNPGPGAIGAVIYDQNSQKLASIKQYIGLCTNNQAEYQALISGLLKAKELGAKSADCFLDSELVVRQLNGAYRVKEEKLRELFQKVVRIAGDLQDISFTHIRREKNCEADKLVNQALDEQFELK